MPYADPEAQREAVHLHYMRNKAAYAARRDARRAGNPGGRAEEHKRSYAKRWTRHAARLHMALCRITRDKWLSPFDLDQVATKLATCMNTRTSSVMRMFYKLGELEECRTVGMLRGQPPFIEIDLVYELFIDAMRNRNKPKAKPIELTILNLLLKEKKLGC
jgi:hypothetical protein